MIAETKRLFVGLLVIMLCCFFAACEKTVSPTMHSSARIQIDLSKAGSNKYRAKLVNDLFPMSTVEGKYKTALRTAAHTSAIDEVMLVVLDMTAYKDWNAFREALNASGQITYFNDLAMTDSSNDYADFVNMSFKGYSGKLFGYAGSCSVPVVSSTVATTLMLNPGLNYVFYAFRSGGKTVDYGDLSLIVSETEDNVVRVGTSYIPVQGLLAYYPFDGNTRDASGYARDMVNNGATFTTGFDGKANSAVYFSNRATLRYENAADIQANLYNPKASVSLWVNVPNNWDVFGTQGGSSIFNVSGDWGDNEGIGISIPTADSSIYVEINVNNTKKLPTAYRVRFGKYTHIVMTYDGTTYKYYVNDTLWSSVAASGVMTYSKTYHKMGIGWWDAVPTYEHYFTGTVDNVRLYNRALTESEIDALYHETTTDNFPPNMPELATPTNNATGISTSASLSWTCEDYENDPLTYDVYLGTSATDIYTVATGISVVSYSLKGAVQPNTTYYWKIVVKDDHGNSNYSGVWSFTTGSN